MVSVNVPLVGFFASSGALMFSACNCAARVEAIGVGALVIEAIPAV